VLLAGAVVGVAPGVAATAARSSHQKSASVPYPGQLNAVTAAPGGNAWAVGYEPGATLVQRWNGKAWRHAPSLDLGPSGDLYGVAATSANSAWAVGYLPGPTNSATLIARWNGKAWKRVSSPNPGPDGSILQGVAVTSARNAWAVGETGGEKSVILHWNGKAWKRVSSPSPGPEGNFLYGVAAASARSAWAVGYADDEGTITTLILHWNGKAWKRVPSPSPSGSILNGVAATSAANAWAVGYTAVYSEGWKTLILHWNGKVWRQVPSPDPVAVSSTKLTVNTLQGVTAGAAGATWAVGYSEVALKGSKTMILHWNGKAWKQAPSPNPFCATCDILYGVTASSARSAWAVGTVNAGGEVVILRWNGKTWKNSSSAPVTASVSTASAGLASPASVTKARPLPVLYNLAKNGNWNLAQRKPAIFFLAADGSAALGDKAHHLKWTRWAATSAAAKGDYYYRTGPCCKYHSDAVTITANHVVRQNARTSWYDRITIRFSERKSVTLQFERIDGFGFWKTIAGRFP
jgi:hypothetical protein